MLRSNDQRKSRKHIAKMLLLGFALFLLIFGLFLPTGVKHYLNEYVFKDMGEYRGHVDRIKLDLFAGAYTLVDFKVVRKSSEKDIPFYEVHEMMFSISTKALRQGDISFAARLVKPQIHFMDARKESNRQTGEGGYWLTTLESIVPTNVSTITVENGVLSFVNLDSKPVIDVRASDIAIHVENLTRLESTESERAATAHFEGALLKYGQFSGDVSFDPENYTNFDLKVKSENIRLPNLNDLFRVYANFDFESGDARLFSELSGRDESIKGYIKPIVEDINILSWEQDVEEQSDDVLQFVWEGLAGFLQTIFTNQSTDKFATEVTIDAKIDKVGIDAVQAFAGVIENAFIEAVEEGFNGTDSGDDDKS